MLLFAAVGGTALALVALSAGSPRAIEMVAVLAALIGLGVAFGAEPSPRRSGNVTGTDAPVATLTTAAIDALDRVEHRRFELGSPWPQMVVGPTGVSIVELCPQATLVHDGPGGVRAATPDASCERCEGSLALAARIRDEVAGVVGGRPVPVRVLTVVPPGAPITVDVDHPSPLVPVHADRLRDALARGPVLPMAVVDQVFLQLARFAGAAREPHGAS